MMTVIATSIVIEIFLLYGMIKKNPKKYFYYFIHPHSAQKMNPIGIWENNLLLGYAHIPNAQGVHQTSDFSVTYHIGPEGERFIPKPEHPKGRLLFLGDSWTFGHGVQDDEVYPSILAKEWQDWWVLNKAVMGWGTVHAYQLLLQEFKSATPPDAVIYQMLGDHVDRNYITKQWLHVLAQYGRSHPHFEVVHGRPEFQGIVTLPQGEDGDLPGFSRKKIELTQALLREMNRLCREKNIPFIVILFYGKPPEAIYETFRKEHILFLDLTGLKTEIFPHDGHPNSEGHKVMAAAIQNSFIPLMLEKTLRHKSVGDL